MAGERCNLDKDEAEILKPSSSNPSPPPTSSSPSPPPPPPTSSPSPPPPPSSSTTPPSLFLNASHEFSAQRPETPAAEAAADVARTPEHNEESQPPVRFINRCCSCRKRVGLTGFRCRCGELFCALHRYSETHDCSFDYKAYGREEIAKNNPVVRAAKIIKIWELVAVRNLQGQPGAQANCFIYLSSGRELSKLAPIYCSSLQLNYLYQPSKLEALDIWVKILSRWPYTSFYVF